MENSQSLSTDLRDRLQNAQDFADQTQELLEIFSTAIGALLADGGDSSAGRAIGVGHLADRLIGSTTALRAAASHPLLISGLAVLAKPAQHRRESAKLQAGKRSRDELPSSVFKPAC